MNQRGHTLVEVTITSLLVAVLAMGVSGAWRALGGATIKLQHRARAATELRAVVEFLRQDFGAAGSVQVTGGGKLRIRWIAEVKAIVGSQHVDYEFADGKLTRKNPSGDATTVVGIDLVEFEVEEGEEEEVTVRIAAGEGLGRRAVTLRWAP